MTDVADTRDATIAGLERALAARDRTIDVLFERAETRGSSSGASFALLEQNAQLEQTVARRTKQLKEEHKKLEVALAELRTTQARLIQAQTLEAIGQLAAGIAHEINTPVQYVSDNTVFLQRAFKAFASALEDCERVVSAVEGGADAGQLAADARAALKRAKIAYISREIPRAIEQSLEGLTRVTSIVSAMKGFSHQTKSELQAIDLREAILTTLTVARNEWKYIADVDTDFDPELGPVPCYRNELNQVMLNLIVNAAHAISDATSGGKNGKGKISLSTKLAGDKVELRIGDSGVGIPENIRAHVFEPFFTTKEVGKGTGQGLAIAYSIVVEKHHGAISFESEPGKGTTFLIELPLKPLAAEVTT